MNIYDPKERDAASKALIAWFKSQDLTPGEAMGVISRVIAIQIVGMAVAGYTTPEKLTKEIEEGRGLVLSLIRDDITEACLKAAGVERA